MVWPTSADIDKVAWKQRKKKKNMEYKKIKKEKKSSVCVLLYRNRVK